MNAISGFGKGTEDKPFSNEYQGVQLGPARTIPRIQKDTYHATELCTPLAGVRDERVRFLVLRYCSIARARFLPRVMPYGGKIRRYAHDVDREHDQVIAGLLGVEHLRTHTVKAQRRCPRRSVGSASRASPTLHPLPAWRHLPTSGRC